MKTLFYICLLALFPFTRLQAQRLLPFQKGIGVNIGVFSFHQANQNYFVSLDFTTNHKKGNYHFWTAEYQRRTASYKEISLPVETFLGGVGYSFHLLGLPSKRVNLNTSVDANGGYQLINRSNSLLNDGAEIKDESRFVYGAGGRLSVETYLTNSIIIYIQGKAQYLWGTKYNQFRPSAGIGIRINL